MRTVIAPLAPEVEAQLAALDPRLAAIARRFMRRLVLEPQLGHPLARWCLASRDVRAVYFDEASEPNDLFGRRGSARRKGDEDLGAGPRWGVVERAAPPRGPYSRQLLYESTRDD